MKIFLLALGALLLLLVVLALALPFLIDLNQYQDRYRPLIEDALNRKIQLTDMRLTVIPRLGVRIAGFTVMDDPAFSAATFASLSSVDVGVKLLPLLTGRIEVEEILLADPMITVIKNERGELNISTLGKGPGKPAPPEAPPAPPAAEGPLRVLSLLAVDNVSLTGGRLGYEDHSTKKPTEYRVQDLTVKVRSVRLGDTPAIRVAAVVQPFNLPVKIDGEVGPLTKTMDLQTIDLDLALGRTTFAVKGSAVAGRFNLTLTSPTINSDDLPVVLPLTKPVVVKDLRVTTEGLYPLNEKTPVHKAVDIKALDFVAAMGDSTVHVKGNVLGGDITLTATSPSVSTADLPLSLPLTSPVQARNFALTARAKYPFKKSVPPADLLDLSTLTLDAVMGNSVVTVKGTAADGQIKLTATSPSVNTVHLPIKLPLKKPVEAKDLKLTADLKGREARIQNLGFGVFGGQLTSHGRATIEARPPFAGELSLQSIQLGPALAAITDKVAASGTAATQLALQGRGLSKLELSDSLAGTGHIVIKNGTIEGFNLLHEALTLLKAAGIRIESTSVTAFSTIEANVSLKDGVATVERGLIDSHDFQGRVTGLVGFNQALDLKANLFLSEGLSKQIAATRPAAELVMTGRRITVPMIITGTAQAPRFALDLRAIGATAQEQIKRKAGELLKQEGVDIEKGKEALKKLFGR